MPVRTTQAFAVTICLLLAGCNTDGLTPQAEVPGADKTVDATPTQTQSQQIDEIPVDPSQPKPLIDSEPVATDVRQPQNTLEAQAQVAMLDRVDHQFCQAQHSLVRIGTGPCQQ